MPSECVEGLRPSGKFEIEFRGYAQVLGRSPKFIEPIDGSAERFRTSGGIAESRWLNFLGKAGARMWRG